MPRVIAYTYESDIHCVECAAKRFPSPEGRGMDENAKDNDGNPIHPVFDTDERTGTEMCRDCFEPI